MSDIVEQVGNMLLGAESMLSIMGLVMAVFTPSTDRWSRTYFIRLFVLLVAYSLCLALDTLTYRHPEFTHLLRILWYLEIVLSALLVLMLTAFLLHCCGMSQRHSPLMRVVTTLCTFLFLMLNVTPLSVWFDYVYPEARFVRGPLYPLLLLVLNAMLLSNLACAIRWRHRLSSRDYLIYLVSIIPMTCALILQHFVDVLMLFGFGMSVCTFALYYHILLDQNERDLAQQREIARQQANVTVLQMRPHFIYNTMMSIYYLCQQDPVTAQQVTLDFTHYLRKNFSAVASEGPIPFTEELEHARAYLAVEHAQFEDLLFIHYDTPHLDFRLPPLTLQPLVENAIKHGMDPDGEPLHIFVTTRRTPSAHEVIVANTGTDFDLTDNGEPHIALRNIRQRLEMMCDATLEIQPREGGGTQVRVAIPAISE